MRRLDGLGRVRHQAHRLGLGRGLRLRDDQFLDRRTPAGWKQHRREPDRGDEHTRAPHQNSTLTPNWNCRAVPTVVVICPAFGTRPLELKTVVAGSPRFTWSVMLNPSTRS